MIIEIWEGRFPSLVDRKQVEDHVNNIAKPACEKAGYKMVRYAWVHTDGPGNTLIAIGELETLADVERVGTVKEYQEANEEFDRRFPDAKTVRSKILHVIE